jgi:tRNA(Arg) A34 adenosine deaminase TadA
MVTDSMAASESNLIDRWDQLALGARMAFDQQWLGLAAGGLPCGSSILNDQGEIVAIGRNHVYDLPQQAGNSPTSPLQYTRVAHAEINALAFVPSDREPELLTLWTTQHPCIMCAAAIKFIGIGKVCYIADDPSDVSPSRDIIASRGNVPYEALGDRLWWTVSNLLFLYNSAVKQGEDANNLRKNRDRYPTLVELALHIAKDDTLGKSARAGIELPQALLPCYTALLQTASKSDL